MFLVRILDLYQDTLTTVNTEKLQRPTTKNAEQTAFYTEGQDSSHSVQSLH